MKNTLILRAAAVAFSVAGAFGVQAQTLQLGHITPPTHVWHQVSEQIGAGLEKASGGKMKVAVSPLQKLGNEAQMINLMQAGAQALVTRNIRDFGKATLPVFTPAELINALDVLGRSG